MLIVPTLQTGGMERVVSTLANEWANIEHLEVHVVVLSNKPISYNLNYRVEFHSPKYDSSKHNFITASIKSIFYLVRLTKKLKPDTILAFGDRYNSLSILAGRICGRKIYISNRQNPFISNGIFIDTLNKFMYQFGHGFIAQTRISANQFGQKYNLKNIATIPNPFPSKVYPNIRNVRKKMILNVGRFGDQKNQFDLVRYFVSINNPEWELVFLGDGAKRYQTEEIIAQLSSEKQLKIKLLGTVKDVENYYCQAAIFAFTSRSEGFPNALGEAMQAGCACISYDCIAGPSELIDNGLNGFLIELGNEQEYVKKLQMLMEDSEIRNKFGENAKKKMSKFSVSQIAKQYLDFIFPIIE